MLFTTNAPVDPAKPFHLVTFLEAEQITFVESFSTKARAVANYEADKATSGDGVAWVLVEVHDGDLVAVEQYAIDQYNDAVDANPGGITFG